ncbi:hypothetical protein F0562_003040 [Nyssa sinensis]|uniref:Protein kinase domain-containing protein n=1 Tax=Nyssa sinensis TaxID=561372 RepID=A0A5J5BY88_9ASTE|nr:hypothetical protein F0562_003040 [Nyssa sinensis]
MFSPQQKKSTMFSPWHSPLRSPVLNSPPPNPTTQSRSCCRGLNDCIIIGPTVSHQPTALKLEHQVAELEKEVQKQKELKATYKMRLERTQDYLRFCLQVAQENGFLDIITDNKDSQKQRLVSSDIIQSSISPPPVHHRQDLAALINQAKMNGCFFAQEVETLSRQRHRFVLGLMGACLDPPDCGWVVTELLGMTLKEWLHGQGTYVYMAPEVIRCEPYDEKCDAYSFGIILNELVTGESPYIETDYGPSRIALEVAEGKLRPALPKDDDHHQLEELIDLIQLSWNEDAAIRPSFATITRSLRKIQQIFIDTIWL